MRGVSWAALCLLRQETAQVEDGRAAVAPVEESGLFCTELSRTEWNRDWTVPVIKL